uniref:Uncharacterized protein n=1 Tax=Populus alba TaxID=43335 RepID=A0A4U5QYV2_POPAL|nr:hypothetical protein D5086_0000022470 [Populus alba]
MYSSPICMHTSSVDVHEVRRTMLYGVRKTPGKSLVELGNHVHEFVMGDWTHPQSKTINEILVDIAKKLKLAGLCEGGYEDFELHALETTTSIWSSSRKTGEYCWSGTRECTCCMCECGECSSMHGEEMAGEGAARSMGAGLEVEEETEIDKDTEEESSDYKMERRYLRSAVARVATRRSNRRASGTPCMFPHDFFFVRDYCG